MKLYERHHWENNYPEDKSQKNCPFCESESEYYIYETKHWRIMHNKFPILWLKQHLMASPKHHYILAKDMPSEVFEDYRNVEIFIANFFWKASYFTFMRETVDGRSIEHLHYHFLPGKLFYKNLEIMLREQGFKNQLDLEQE